MNQFSLEEIKAVIESLKVSRFIVALTTKDKDKLASLDKAHDKFVFEYRERARYGEDPDEL